MITDNTIRSIAKAAARQEVKNPARESVTTTNATATVIKTILLDSWTGGILEVSVVGKADLGTGSITGKKIVRYDKSTTLTLGTPVDVLALQTDITGGTFSISAVSDNIEISVTGAASTVINWSVETKLFNQTGTTPP